MLTLPARRAVLICSAKRPQIDKRCIIRTVLILVALLVRTAGAGVLDRNIELQKFRTCGNGRVVVFSEVSIECHDSAGKDRRRPVRNAGGGRVLSVDPDLPPRGKFCSRNETEVLNNYNDIHSFSGPTGGHGLLCPRRSYIDGAYRFDANVWPIGYIKDLRRNVSGPMRLSGQLICGSRLLSSFLDGFGHLSGLRFGLFSQSLRGISLLASSNSKIVCVFPSTAYFNISQDRGTGENKRKNRQTDSCISSSPGEPVRGSFLLLLGFALTYFGLKITDQPKPPIGTRLVFLLAMIGAFASILQGMSLLFGESVTQKILDGCLFV
jgi:hypothetical protein